MIGGMMGVHVHPALKALIGVVLTVVGLSRHHAAAMVVLGIVVFVWGLFLARLLTGSGPMHDLRGVQSPLWHYLSLGNRYGDGGDVDRAASASELNVGGAAHF